MKTQKRTYALPQVTVEKFEQTVASGQRSATLAHLIEAWLEKQREEALEREIIEGCREMSDVYLEIQREFDPLDTEVTRAFYPG
ncbi:MAG: hypothetical protein ACRYFS_14870 [Janthinobacterium lividum]